jgi:DNA (cytosine-5)-methyltransferase 1
MKNNRRPIGVDLFSGAGGLSLGFEQAGFDILAAVEIDPIHCATHEFNFPFWDVICRSIENIKAKDIRSLSKIGSQEIDVVFGGPPCQGFSMIGKRELNDSRNLLIGHFLRVVLELKPKYFVMENVSGITIGEHKKLLLEIISEFKRNGYDIAEPYRVLNALNYGVPQNRKRLFLIGGQKGRILPDYPKPFTSPPSQMLKNYLNLPLGPTVQDAINDLPDVGKFPELFEKDSVKAKYGKASEYAKILRGIIESPDDYSYGREYNQSLLTSSALTVHTRKSIERFSKTKIGSTEPISRFYRLDPNGTCNTLRAGTASNRGAFTSPRPLHPYQPRCITVREAARLHSYPDWFRFHVTKWHGFRQIGNSVPPMLGKSVAKEIFNVLGNKISKPSGKRILGDEKLLTLVMTQAAKRYGVNPQVIEPRTRREEKDLIYA